MKSRSALFPSHGSRHPVGGCHQGTHQARLAAADQLRHSSCKEMVAADLEIARRDAVVAREGFKTYRVSRMNPDAPIFVAGHRGLVGSAIVRRLQRAGFEQHRPADARRAGSDATGRGRGDSSPRRGPQYVFLARPRRSAASSPTAATRRSSCRTISQFRPTSSIAA